MDQALLERIAYTAPVLLFSVIAHEYAHGYAALKQGDTTAYQMGRLTWNPAKHIDPFMTILFPAFLLWVSGGRLALGAAKPVPVNARNYRHYKRGDIIVSLAGVATNLLLAIIAAAVFAVLGVLGRAAPGAAATLGILQTMMVIGVELNLALMAFNLIPIPPLDGSHVMKYLLPPAWAISYQRIGALGFFILLLLLQFGGPFLSWWFTPARLIGNLLLGAVAPWGLQVPVA